MKDPVFQLSKHALYRYKKRLETKGVSLQELDDDIINAKFVHGFYFDSNRMMLKGEFARYVISSGGIVVSVLPIEGKSRKKS